MSSKINWLELQPSWFRTATDDELRGFVQAVDNGEMPIGSKYNELKAAFDRECSRRSGEHYEHLGNGEWI